MKSKTVIFFGNERLATGVSTTAPTLSKLIKASYNVAAVIANNEVAKSRKSKVLEVAEVAKANNIPVYLPKNLKEFKDKIMELKPDIGVLVAYGKIVPEEIIEIFPKGILNIHPSLLPKHRGPTPIESVILNGSEKTGVSIMKLVKAMDAGPIYAQKELILNKNESKQELSDKLLKIGGNLIINNIDKILNDELEAYDQDGDPTYDNLINKSDGLIDWSNSAELIERQIRAYQYWPNSYTNLNGLDLAIISAEVIKQNNNPGQIIINKNSLIIGCGNNSLSIKRIKPAGKNEMDISQFIAGYSKIIG